MKDKDLKKYLPLGAGLLGAAGIYALMRAPLWGAKSFAPLRKQFGNKATLILASQTEKVNPTLSKILSGFDKTIIAPAEKNIAASEIKGFGIDLRGAFPPTSSANIKFDAESWVATVQPGTYMSAIAPHGKVMPETTLLKSMGDKAMETPEALKTYILDATKGIPIEKTILKPNTMASKTDKVFTTEEVLKDPTEFHSVLKHLFKRKAVTDTGTPEVSVYLQKNIPGETYRATMLNDAVVPGSVTKRHSVLGSLIDKLTGANKDVERKLSEKVKREYPFNKATKELFNPDFQVVRDASGNISDIKIVDLNWNGAAGNIVPNTNPLGSWTLSRALTGKQPRILASSAAVGTGTGTYFLTRKKKKSV